jgi:aminoglycoside/choline kinase family phosphotransferase
MRRMLEEPILSQVLIPFVRSFAGGGAAQVQTLAGDASTRRYHRVLVEGGDPPSVVVMELPPDPLKSEEISGKERPPELPFINVQRYLAAGGIPVPRIYRQDMALGLLALEDLGDRTFEAAVLGATSDERQRLYRMAMDEIVRFQVLGGKQTDGSCVAFSRRFDQQLLRWELGHFQEWFLENEKGVRLSAGESTALAKDFDWIAETVAMSPLVLVHRDFQSRNLMIVKDERGLPTLRVIDFQDALLGSRAYDLVALLRDSYVELAESEVRQWIDTFMDISDIRDSGREDFRRLFVLQTLQRKLKDTGRFIYIDRVRKNPGFLRWIPTSLRYVREALVAAPVELAAMKEILPAHIPELRP